MSSRGVVGKGLGEGTHTTFSFSRVGGNVWGRLEILHVPAVASDAVLIVDVNRDGGRCVWCVEVGEQRGGRLPESFLHRSNGSTSTEPPDEVPN
jgi:hypothetical protein